MSEIKKAYEEGLTSQLTRRPIITTLLVAGAGYFLYNRIKSAIDEWRQEGRAESADTSGSSTSNVSPFNYTAFFNYWKAGNRLPKSYKIFTSATAYDVAEKIYDSMGYTYDNEDVAKAQIKRANSKIKIAQVSEAFTKKYNRDLFTYLKEGVGIRWNAGLDEDELDNILKYVNSLPTYTK